jgi:2-methylcitrate dehydratase PrpD
MGKTESRFAEFIVGTTPDQIPTRSYDTAREACFDGIGCMLAGAATPHGRMIVDFVRSESAVGPCTVVGSGERLGQTMAALANGTLAHALDFDDGWGFGHSAAVLLPTALAAGEPRGISGHELLAAYIIGLEVGANIRRGRFPLNGYPENERGFHTSSVVGSLAAAAVAARLLGLDEAETVTALGIAGSMASGVTQNFGTHTKPLHAGMCSRNGLTAARLAQSGWSACDNILESRVGWSASFLGNGHFDTNTMVRDLGSVWAASNHLKAYPCCGSNHGALDALLPLIAEHGFTADEVAEVEVSGLPYEAECVVLLYPEPVTAFQGKFSIHYTLATALIDGKIDVDSYTEDKIRRPEYADARRKVQVRIAPKWQTPPTGGPTTVVVRLHNGAVYERSIDAHFAHGTRHDPLTLDEQEAKFRDNATRSLDSEHAQQALDAWWRIDQTPDIRTALATVAEAAPIRMLS